MNGLLSAAGEARMPVARQAAGLAGWLLACFAAAAAGGFASVNAAGSYQQLVQPAWAPPPWLFGPVWSVLYALMAMAAWLVWRRHGFGGAGPALKLFVGQLVANALWTWLFFAWRQGLLALLDIALLWAMILAVAVAFWRLHRLAAVLLLPYLGWVSFAAALNFTLWRLNPTVLG